MTTNHWNVTDNHRIITPPNDILTIDWISFQFCIWYNIWILNIIQRCGRDESNLWENEMMNPLQNIFCLTSKSQHLNNNRGIDNEFEFEFISDVWIFALFQIDYVLEKRFDYALSNGIHPMLQSTSVSVRYIRWKR